MKIARAAMDGEVFSQVGSKSFWFTDRKVCPKFFPPPTAAEKDKEITRYKTKVDGECFYEYTNYYK
jgi:hypothetical protein